MKINKVTAVYSTSCIGILLLQNSADAFAPSRLHASLDHVRNPRLPDATNRRLNLYVDRKEAMPNSQEAVVPKGKTGENKKQDEAECDKKETKRDDQQDAAPTPPSIADDEHILSESEPEYETKRIPYALLRSRTLDTLEDAFQIGRRVPHHFGWSSSPSSDEKPIKQRTIVVLGSGWAAHALMNVADTYAMNLIVVSPVNHFVFTPMLASAAVGSVEYRSMTAAVRSSNSMAKYVEGKAVDIDVKGKTIKVELNTFLDDTYHTTAPPDPVEISYDSLVVAVGTQVRTSMAKGADAHCYYLKTCQEARRLRTAIGQALEYASRPDVDPIADATKAGKLPNKTTRQDVNDDNAILQEEDDITKERRRRLRFCVVGGGPTGVELAGELGDFFSDICHPNRGMYPQLADDYEIVLIEGEDKLIPMFDPKMQQRALESLQRRGRVSVRLNTFTTEVGDGFVKLKDRASGTVEVLPVGITVWTAGVEPVPFCSTLLEQLPASARGVAGRINVDKWMRPPMPSADLDGSIFVLGDAAAFIDKTNEDITTSQSYLPQTAQVAGQQGAFMARLLNRNYNLTMTPPSLMKKDANDTVGSTPQPMLSFDFSKAWLQLRGLDEAAPAFEFLNLGKLAYIGNGEALSEIQIGDVPVFSYFGSTGYVLWRSVYLVKQVALRNRVLVSIDWLKTAVFGRDLTRF